MPEQAIQQYVSDGSELSIARAPEQVMAEAKKAAEALMRAVALKPKPVKFNGETYLEFEDWAMVAKFYGCTAKIESTNPVTFGGVHGFEATAVCVDKNGNEISRADSMCLSDEANWGAVPKYEWKDVLDANGKKIWDQNARNGKGGYKSEKVQVGTEPKPLFQLRSMAQTRACSKVLRQVFSWVVVLAGFKPTAAEELIESQMDDQPQKQQKAQPNVQRKSEKGSIADLKQETAICAECRQTEPKHAADCSHHPANQKQQESSNLKKDGTPKKSVEELTRDWDNYPGHDPKIHISLKQKNHLFAVTHARGISHEEFKEWLQKNLNVDSSRLIEKTYFTPILDALDPEFQHHNKPQEALPIEDADVSHGDAYEGPDASEVFGS